MNTLSELVIAFQEIEHKLSLLEKQLNSESWAQTPSTGGWTRLQNIEHLNLITSDFLDRFQEVSGQLKTQESASYRLDLLGRLLTRALSSKGRMLKMKSPPKFAPVAQADDQTELSKFHQNQQRLVTFIRSAENKTIDRVKIVSPFDERFRYSIFSALNILSAEQNRHFRQIERSIQ